MNTLSPDLTIAFQERGVTRCSAGEVWLFDNSDVTIYYVFIPTVTEEAAASFRSYMYENGHLSQEDAALYNDMIVVGADGQIM